MQIEKISVSQSRKKGLSILKICVLSVLCAVLVLLATAVSFVALSSPRENTLEVFGYKIFCVSEDIGQDIKGGSLVVVKDIDADSFYTHETLSENIVLKIENLGSAIRNNSSWIALCFMTPLMLVFFLILASEIRKAALKREEKRLSDELVISEPDEIEQPQIAEPEKIDA